MIGFRYPHNPGSETSLIPANRSRLTTLNTKGSTSMSSLARSSLRASVAVAGVAAAGLGLAAPAVAAPASPAPLGSDDAGNAPTEPDAGLIPQLAGQLPVSPTGLSDLPMPFQFEAPSVNMDDGQLGVRSGAPQQVDATAGWRSAGTEGETSASSDSSEY
jgi:hypothetical protein